MAEYTALFDACVLYPFQLRDLLLHLSRTDLFRAKWTNDIHDEWIRSLVKNGGDLKKLERTRRLMDQAVPDCLVTGYERLIDSLTLPDRNDRHVLAAAIKADADVIVTTNLRHFPQAILAKFDIEAQHPDDFVVCQLDLDEAEVLAAVKRQRAALRKPPLSIDEFLRSLERVQLPMTVERLRPFSDVL